MRASFQDQTEVRKVFKQTHIVHLSGVDWIAIERVLHNGPCIGLGGWMELMEVPMTKVRSFNEEERALKK